MKQVKSLRLTIVIFTAVKNRCMLHGGVFVLMKPRLTTRHSKQCLCEECTVVDNGPYTVLNCNVIVIIEK